MNYSGLIKSITSATFRVQENVAAVAVQALVIRNRLVGAWVVEFEQSGKDRAKYGQKLLESVAADLAKKEIKGLTDPRVLRDCRIFYRVYPQISGSVTREFGMIALPPATPETLTATHKRIRGSATRELPTPLALEQLMRLSWTHLQELIRLDDPWQRAFYENECLNGRWSIRQLQRQIGSLLYERTGLSTNKRAIIEKAHKQERQQDFTDLIRDPYVFDSRSLTKLLKVAESNTTNKICTKCGKIPVTDGLKKCGQECPYSNRVTGILPPARPSLAVHGLSGKRAGRCGFRTSHSLKKQLPLDWPKSKHSD